MPKKAIWLSYDLGVRGDYEGLYAWLDAHGARECGTSLAVLSYDFSGGLTESLKEDLKAAVELDRKSRIYVIWLHDERKTMQGRFIVGGRKAPPWSGYAENGDQDGTDEG
jgi:hypothetical protein